MDVRDGLWRRLSTEELMLLNCGVGEKTLESPLNYKEIQPVHSKGDHPGCSLEGLMLKLKLQYFGHLMRRTDWFEKTLMLEKIENRRRRGGQRMRWLDGIANSMDVSLSELRSWWWTGRPGVLRFMGSQRVRHNWPTELKGCLVFCCGTLGLPRGIPEKARDLKRNLMKTSKLFTTVRHRCKRGGLMGSTCIPVMDSFWCLAKLIQLGR